MAITYEWNCRTLDTYTTASDSQTPINTHNDVVYNVQWELKGSIDVDGETKTTSNRGNQELSTEDLTNFTSFESITHEQVIGWVTASMANPDYPDPVVTIKNSVSRSLAEIVNPTKSRKILD